MPTMRGAGDGVPWRHGAARASEPQPAHSITRSFRANSEPVVRAEMHLSAHFPYHATQLIHYSICGRPLPLPLPPPRRSSSPDGQTHKITEFWRRDLRLVIVVARRAFEPRAPPSIAGRQMGASAPS